MGPIVSPFKPFKSVYLGIHTFGGFPKMPGKVVVSYRLQPLFKFFLHFLLRFCLVTYSSSFKNGLITNQSFCVQPKIRSLRTAFAI